MAYEFNKIINTKKFEMKIDTNAQYGFFEHNELGDECGGGLWFEGLELVDYDGVYELPKEVREALKAEGYTGDTLED